MRDRSVCQGVIRSVSGAVASWALNPLIVRCEYTILRAVGIVPLWTGRVQTILRV